MKLSILKTSNKNLLLMGLLCIAFTLIGCATEDSSSSSAIFEGLASSGTDIILDGSNNPVVTGFGYGDVSTDSGSSEANVFLSRHNNGAGTTLSFALKGSSEEDFAQAVVQLGTDFYVVGHTYGDLTTDAALGGTDIFLMQFDSSGTWQWTKQYGTSKNDYCWDVTTDSTNLYLVGNTEGVFPGVSGKTNNHGNDIFLLKLDSSGTQLGVAQIGEDTAINSNVYSQSYGVSIGFDGTDVIIGGITNDAIGGSKIGGNDIVLAKYTTGLSQTWIQQIGTAYDDSITDMALDGTEIYFTGFSYGTPDAAYDYSAAGYSEDHSYTEVFLYRYDTSGNQIWVSQSGTATYDRAYALDIDGSSNIYVTGSTNGDLEGTNAGSYDFFILKYQNDGSLIWNFQYGSDVYDTARGIAVNAAGDNIFITGKTYGELYSTSNSSSSFSTFVIKYDSTPDNGPLWTEVY